MSAPARATAISAEEICKYRDRTRALGRCHLGGLHVARLPQNVHGRDG